MAPTKPYSRLRISVPWPRQVSPGIGGNAAAILDAELLGGSKIDSESTEAGNAPVVANRELGKVSAVRSARVGRPEEASCSHMS
ncbi:hypothetical protein GCM10007862_11950 [Dyella lipolytica]|nr:hypothetical protein GCM10007862_11950 [Dyella lipolytica]